ncbi:MAG: hypothetical protein QJR03_09235 [Sphaerobacter sp.]|nr:hypothetical protein [Sphaerobacter sp.]
MESLERLYGRAVVAFVLLMMLNFVALFGLMAIGIWQGFRITWF